ncbi:EthD domain-containing protein [Cupriavidus lacunae]|uniref:EthD family reductase n=1 Tax=Cupriavidus lacunae TaxID=2666307 RepID=A0A370NX13_9BURK|nr:EthD domain-containing protein [Cupriavidus lacunae]RDK10123.1 EthD family reductase [Cupriavidus lacunae]
MIKIVFCLRRLPSLSRAEFQAYWRDMHAPLVAEHAPTLGIERYVQCHTLDDATFASFSRSRGGHPPFDGVAELWFSEVPAGPVEERRRASQILLDDEHRFIDLPASPIFFTREHEVLKDFIDLRARR